MRSALYAAAERYDTILVDFFDTVVHRRVHPTEIIRLWSEQVRPCAGILCDAARLHKIRMQALEKFDPAHLNYSNADWMRELHTRLRNSLLIRENVPFERFLQASVAVEEMLEIQSQFPNENVLAPLRELRAKGKKIHIVSDFYLPKESVERFLQAIGARDIFDGIFVSCDFGKTKSDGSLYPAVLEKIGVSAKQAFMIGDNRKSDCENAVRHGIASFLLRHRYNNLPLKAAKRLLGLETTKSGFERAWAKHERACRWSEFPFSEYALVFFFFTAKLFRELKQREIRDIVFLSREGWMLKKFFETYQARAVPETERIRTHYLKMSRQSAAILRLKPLGEEGFPYFSDISVHDFLAGCGFSHSQMETLAQSLPPDFPKPDASANNANGDNAAGAFHEAIPQFKDSKFFAQLVESELFQKFYEQNRAENRTAFAQMFAEMGIPQGAQIGVVDVGWTGRMQDAIHELTGHPTAGFYVGLKIPASLGEGVSKNGLIFSTIPSLSRYYPLLAVNTQIYEQLLMAPHGSAVSYSLDSDGKCVVNENYRDAEKTVFMETVRPVQEFMEKVFNDLCDDIRLRAHEWDGDDWLAPALALLTLKSGLLVNARRREFIRKISSGFVDNFAKMGVGKEYDAKKILNRKKLFELVRNPSSSLKYAVKICTIRNPFLRAALFLFAALPCYVFLYLGIAGESFNSYLFSQCKRNF